MSDGRGIRSPWIDQLRPDDPASPLDSDLHTDVVVVGAGIAGAATAFFVLRGTDRRVALVERGRIGLGATGHNAGLLATFFERPLAELAESFGVDVAIAAQRAVDDAWDLIEQLLEETGSDQPLERFTGTGGLRTLDHVVEKLRECELRRTGGLHVPDVWVSADAPFLATIPDEFAHGYEVVPHDVVRDAMGRAAVGYWAVVRFPTGAANGALLVQHIVDHLRRAHPDRFVYADHTKVEHITLRVGDAELTTASRHTLTAERVVLCTNGFVDHVVRDASGAPLCAAAHGDLTGTIGFMYGLQEPGRRAPSATSFVRGEQADGEDEPYLYVTERAWGTDETLVVAGGPETLLDSPANYDPAAPFPDHAALEFEREVLPITHPRYRPDDPVSHRWHGLMAYTPSRVRLVGPEPSNPVLLYNLGCNGVGFLPAIMGGRKIADIIAGIPQPPSLFDPPA